MSDKKRVIIYGGSGALGSSCVATLRSNGCWVCSIDLAANESADANVVAPSSSTLTEQAAAVVAATKDAIGDEKLDAIFCVAGGWVGGAANDEKFVVNCDLAIRQSIWTSVIASQLAARHLKPSGLLVLSGAQPALEATPSMLAYGMAKAAVHQLVQSVGSAGAGLPDGAKAVAILPITLDTPANRKAMGEDKLSGWTQLNFVADLFLSWLSSPPESGKLMKISTHDFNNTVVPV